MTLTADQRAEINRQNARKSTGPKSDAGKDKARRNALKHGLRANVVPLPEEDPAAIEARADAWNDYYRPESPAAQHLVNVCVRATVLSDRVARYHDASLAKQARDARRDWDETREDAVNALLDLLHEDPEAALRQLKRTGHGCRALLERWENLKKAFERKNWWSPAERDLAILLRGSKPDKASLKHDADGYLIRFYSHLALGTAREFAERELNDREWLPDSVYAAFSRRDLPDAETARGELRATIAAELKDLHEREARLVNDHECHDRAGAADRALILQDDRSAKLFLRYHAESRSTFHRAYSALEKALKADADRDPETVETAERNTACGTSSAAETVSPNEANATAAASPNEAETPEAASPNEAKAPAAAPPNEVRAKAEPSPNEATPTAAKVCVRVAAEVAPVPPNEADRRPVRLVAWPAIPTERVRAAARSAGS